MFAGVDSDGALAGAAPPLIYRLPRVKHYFLYDHYYHLITNCEDLIGGFTPQGTFLDNMETFLVFKMCTPSC